MGDRYPPPIVGPPNNFEPRLEMDEDIIDDLGGSEEGRGGEGEEEEEEEGEAAAARCANQNHCIPSRCGPRSQVAHKCQASSVARAQNTVAFPSRRHVYQHNPNTATITNVVARRQRPSPLLFGRSGAAQSSQPNLRPVPRACPSRPKQLACRRYCHFGPSHRKRTGRGPLCS